MELKTVNLFECRNCHLGWILVWLAEIENEQRSILIANRQQRVSCSKTCDLAVYRFFVVDLELDIACLQVCQVHNLIAC